MRYCAPLLAGLILGLLIPALTALAVTQYCDLGMDLRQ